MYSHQWSYPFSFNEIFHIDCYMKEGCDEGRRSIDGMTERTKHLYRLPKVRTGYTGRIPEKWAQIQHLKMYVEKDNCSESWFFLRNFANNNHFHLTRTCGIFQNGSIAKIELYFFGEKWTVLSAPIFLPGCLAGIFPKGLVILGKHECATLFQNVIIFAFCNEKKWDNACPFRSAMDHDASSERSLLNVLERGYSYPTTINQ